MEVTGQVGTLFVIASLWFHHGLPSVVHDLQPLVAEKLGTNATASAVARDDLTSATRVAISHTVLITVGLLVGHQLIRRLSLSAFTAVSLAVAAAAFVVLRQGGAEALGGFDYIVEVLGTSADDTILNGVAASHTAWILAGLLLPLVDSSTCGIFPEATVRYLPTMTCVYLGTHFFFYSILPTLWNTWLRHAARGVLGLEGSFPAVADDQLISKHALFLSTTHVLSLSAGIAGCYYARVLLHRIDKYLDPIPSGPTVRQGPSKSQIMLYTFVILGLGYEFVQFVDAIVGTALDIRTDRVVQLGATLFGGIDGEVIRHAAMVSYGFWFVLGGAFELTWPISESNRPKERGGVWRLRREDAGGVAAPKPSKGEAAKHDKVRGGPPPAPERGWTSTALPLLGMLALYYPLPTPALFLVAAMGAYRATFYPEHMESVNTYDHTSERYRRIRRANFPPAYPNSWYRVCNSADLDGERIKSISALGRELVAFRGEDGRVGILDAFCPHLGAHLGAGCVKGNSIQCPYHNWEFDASGKCTHIPYSRFNPPRGEAFCERTKAKAYEVREHLGMVFIWYDAEGRPPQWEMKYHLDVMDTDRFYFATMGQLEFDMHISEAHENSADWYHFQTLHRPFPIPGLSRVIAGRHDIRRRYGEGDLTGAGKGKGPDRDIPLQEGEEKHIVVFDEEMDTLYFLGQRIPFISGRTGGAHVIFEGPAMMQFTIDLPMGLGRTRMIKTFLPVSPFKLQIEVRWFAEKTVCPHVVHFMRAIAACALQQDREVWDRKLYRPVSEGHSYSKGSRPLTLADNDGPFRQFREWYGQFYSDHSADMDDPSKYTW